MKVERISPSHIDQDLLNTDMAAGPAIGKDRRLNPRYPVYGGTFAVLHQKTQADSASSGAAIIDEAATSGEAAGSSVAVTSDEVAQILDLSLHGIGLRYLVGAEQLLRFNTVDITLPSHGIAILDLPVRLANHSDALSGRCRQASGCRRMGMRFVKLSRGESRALSSFIDRFACGPAT